MQHIVRFELNSRLEWRVFRSRNENWVAVCDPLSLTLEGETWQDLTANIGEGLQLLFQDLLETGELADFLKRHEWTPTVPLKRLDPARTRFDVPWTTRFDRHGTRRPFVHS
jgi:predicted RNase H-like HicB family nuclease